MFFFKCFFFSLFLFLASIASRFLEPSLGEHTLLGLFFFAPSFLPLFFFVCVFFCPDPPSPDCPKFRFFFARSSRGIVPAVQRRSPKVRVWASLNPRRLGLGPHPSVHHPKHEKRTNRRNTFCSFPVAPTNLASAPFSDIIGNAAPDRKHFKTAFAEETLFVLSRFSFLFLSPRFLSCLSFFVPKGRFCPECISSFCPNGRLHILSGTPCLTQGPALRAPPLKRAWWWPAAACATRHARTATRVPKQIGVFSTASTTMEQHPIMTFSEHCLAWLQTNGATRLHELKAVIIGYPPFSSVTTCPETRRQWMSLLVFGSNHHQQTNPFHGLGFEDCLKTKRKNIQS